jgi:hypothetical protein
MAFSSLSTTGSVVVILRKPYKRTCRLSKTYGAMPMRQALRALELEENLVQSPAGVQRTLGGYLGPADMRRLGLLHGVGFRQVAGSRCCCLRKPCQASSFVRVAGTEPLHKLCSWIRSSGSGLGSTGRRTSMEVCQILEQADARSGLTEGGSEGPW